MKTILIATLLAAGVLLAGTARANPELAAANCGKCHEMDKKKKGPAYKVTAAKYKGKADAEATMFKFVTDPNGDHPEMKAKPEDVKTVIKWILQQ
ncbi:MAG: cytochrome C' [Aquincola sp.]|nr:cytochrome C' [Aquincola sp.]MDH4287960.1 cytochrome C' [Aquincola sp.]